MWWGPQLVLIGPQFLHLWHGEDQRALFHTFVVNIKWAEEQRLGVHYCHIVDAQSIFALFLKDALSMSGNTHDVFSWKSAEMLLQMWFKKKGNNLFKFWRRDSAQDRGHPGPSVSSRLCSLSAPPLQPISLCPAHFLRRMSGQAWRKSLLAHCRASCQQEGQKGQSLILSSQRTAQAATSSLKAGDGSGPDAYVVCLAEHLSCLGWTVLFSGTASGPKDPGFAMLSVLFPPLHPFCPASPTQIQAPVASPFYMPGLREISDTSTSLCHCVD